LGYLFDSSLPISYNFEFNFTMLSILVTIDSYCGFYSLISETYLKNHSQSESSGFETWKQNLFYKEHESAMIRTLGLMIITLEGIFSFSSIFYNRHYLFVSLI
jgi:hypothetical protein